VLSVCRVLIELKLKYVVKETQKFASICKCAESTAEEKARGKSSQKHSIRIGLMR